MGILDDAIRQHLDLKRRLGADHDELKRLEDEAFGPPSRPGEPDFPSSEDDGAEASTGEGVAVEDRPADAPSEHAPEPDADADLVGAPDLPEEPGDGSAGDVSGGGPAEAPGFYDQSDSEPSEQPGAEGEPDLDLELDLDLDDEAEITPAPPTADPPIESLDTVEHPYEGAIGEPGGGDEGEGEAVPAEGEAEDEGDEEVVEGEITDDEGDDEDVLEETPEFLRDAPEDDELWFEQGEPKDFDF
jgi:hypothetical protein